MQPSVLIAAVLLMQSMFPFAAQASEQDRARALSNAGTIVPLERITEQVRKRHIEHILEVELETEDGAHYYEVEGVDDAGVVRKLKYDAATGELLDEAVDD
ncbi:MAG TPA: PepSY domain-containing protein [Gammaproteobacteria bacterium]